MTQIDHCYHMADGPDAEPPQPAPARRYWREGDQPHPCCEDLTLVGKCIRPDGHHAGCPTPENTAPRWRVGRKLGRTLYKDGVLCGTMDTVELAAAIVEAMNAKEPA